MVRSDGNGSYVVDKNLWKAMLAIIAILLAITGVWGQSILTTVKDAESAIVESKVLDSAQETKINRLQIQLDRIESKIDAALAK
jgi:hypothetical protein